MIELGFFDFFLFQCSHSGTDGSGTVVHLRAETVPDSVTVVQLVAWGSGYGYGYGFDEVLVEGMCEKEWVQRSPARLPGWQLNDSWQLTAGIGLTLSKWECQVAA